jgi:hypothetical protein
MEIYSLDHQIKIMCLQAKSFPEGIQEAFDLLTAKLPSAQGRTYFGISHGNKSGGITYKAAVNENYDGEAKALALETFIVPKGTYLREKIVNWKTRSEKIGETFRTMLTDPRLDQTCPCIERYDVNDVECLVKIKKN